MKLEFENTPKEGHLASRFERLKKKFGDTEDRTTLHRLMNLGEEAVTLMERQGPEKVVLQAGTPGKGRKVVVIPLARILN
ncbi:MAG: hypothetical protein AAB845_02860, partial [Patescibacteria group bacterium]